MKDIDIDNAVAEALVDRVMAMVQAKKAKDKKLALAAAALVAECILKNCGPGELKVIEAGMDELLIQTSNDRIATSNDIIAAEIKRLISCRAS